MVYRTTSKGSKLESLDYARERVERKKDYLQI